MKAVALAAVAILLFIAGCFFAYDSSNNENDMNTQNSEDIDTLYHQDADQLHLRPNPNEPIVSFDGELEGTSVCPGSKSSIHAGCSYVVLFPNVSCTDVREEIVERIKKNQDPKSHKGKYKIIKDWKNSTLASRTTGDGTNYTDIFKFTYSNLRKENSADMIVGGNKGCRVTACSESQVMSLSDYSTNYCNLHNLYCQQKKTSNGLNNILDDDKVTPCKKQKHDLKDVVEKINFLGCPFHNVTQCTR